MYLAVLGLVVAASAGVLIWAVVDLHARDINLDQRVCQVEKVDRLLDKEIVTATGLKLYVPPLAAGVCS